MLHATNTEESLIVKCDSVKYEDINNTRLSKPKHNHRVWSQVKMRKH